MDRRRSSMVGIAISIGVAGCANSPTQSDPQSARAIASLQSSGVSTSASGAERVALSEAPRHAQNAQNATVGEYVLPPSEGASAATQPPKPEGLDPDFAKFDSIKRDLDGDVESSAQSEQGTSELDRKTTERIRKAMLADPRLSYNAKAIGIVTKNGHVTLRGVVNNSKERAALEQITARIVGANKLESEVKVK